MEAASDSDLVLGSRYTAGGEIVNWPPLRTFPSRFGSLYARTILGVQVRDLTSGFRCVHRRVLEAVEPSTLRSQGYVFNIELTYRALLAGFRVTEIPICFRDREAGQSKMSLPIAFEALLVPQLRLLRHERAGRRRIRWRPPPWPRRLGRALGLFGMDPAGNGNRVIGVARNWRTRHVQGAAAAERQPRRGEQGAGRAGRSELAAALRRREFPPRTI